MARRLLILCALLSAGCGAAKVDAPVTDIVSPETASEPAAARPQAYVVKPRDTLHRIALDYGLDHQDLALWNALSNPELITVGQTLRLAPSENPPQVAVVQKQKPPTPPAPPTPPEAIAPQTALIGGGLGAAAPAEAPLPSNVIVKTAPRAEKHPYSQAAQRRLRRQAAAQSPTPAAATPSPQTTAALSAPAETRRRFGVVWSWPAHGGIIGKFSERSKGLDLSGASGAPVFAGADGKIVYVGAGVESYGRLIVIKHANDYLSAYAHNRRTLVGEGDAVVRGQKIAEMGDTGDAGQVKLHFEIRKTGKPIDPLLVLPQRP